MVSEFLIGVVLLIGFFIGFGIGRRRRKLPFVPPPMIIEKRIYLVQLRRETIIFDPMRATYRPEAIPAERAAQYARLHFLDDIMKSGLINEEIKENPYSGEKKLILTLTVYDKGTN